MSTTIENRPSHVEINERLSPASGRREYMIRTGVLESLGRPVHLLKVAVLPLWGDNFRVNVWTGEREFGNTIPHSYFVTADETGAILRAEPPIQKAH